MSNNQTPSLPDFDKEVRELYQERNTRSAKNIVKGFSWVKIWWVKLIAGIIGVCLVSIVSVMATISWWQPQSSTNPIERIVRTIGISAEPGGDIIDRVNNATVTIFLAKGVNEKSLLDQSYLARESLGQGIILSSDGWLVTTQAVVQDPKRLLAVALAGGTVYQVENIIFDPVVPLAYLKINASNLTVLPFIDSNTINSGQGVMAMAAAQGLSQSVYFRHLANINVPIFSSKSDLVVTTEFLPDRHLLDIALPIKNLGSPIISWKGEVIGLATTYEGELKGVLPLDNVGSVMNSLFSEQRIRRPSLGLTYLQTSWLQLPALVVAKLDKGARVTAGSKRPVVLPKSPAGLAGIVEGDVITSFGGEKVGDRSLSSIMQQYKPGAKVELTLKRQGKDVTLGLTLGEIASPAIAANK